MNELKIEFPIVTIEDYGRIGYGYKLDDLIIVPKSIVTKDGYKGLEIIDSSNCYYKIAGTEIREYLGLFKTKCRVNLVFSEESKKDWKSIKDLLTLKVKTKSDFWSEINLLDNVLNVIEISKDSKEFIYSYIEMLNRSFSDRAK